MATGVLSNFMISQKEFLERDDKPKSSWLGSIRNILTGRVFVNWKENLLSVGTVFYVIKAAISFFSGYWIMAIVEILTAGFMGILRKEIHDFTNLHKATGEYQKQNNAHVLANLQLSQTVEEFKDEMVKLHEESEKFRDSNVEYAKHNEVHKNLLKTMDKQIVKSAESIRDELNKGAGVSRRILDEFLVAADTFSEQKKTLTTIKRDLETEQDVAFKRLKKLTNDVAKMDARGAQSLRIANEELQNTQKEVVSATEKLSGLIDQREDLKVEIENLKEVRAGLQEDARRNTETSVLAHEATKRIHSASNNMGMLVKGVLGVTDPNTGEFSPGFNTLIIACVIGGFVGHYLKS